MRRTTIGCCFGLHLGLRQRNLRELLVCPRGQAHTPDRQLEQARRGELRWNIDDDRAVFDVSVNFINDGVRLVLGIDAMGPFVDQMTGWTEPSFWRENFPDGDPTTPGSRAVKSTG